MMSPLDWAADKENREKASLEKHQRLARLFKENRFLFEIERKKMIAEIIDSAGDEKQKNSLRVLQASWDKRMKSAGSEHNRYVLAQTFFWEHFHEKWHPTIKKLSQTLNTPGKN